MDEFENLKNEFERLFPMYQIDYRSDFAENVIYYCYKFISSNGSTWLVLPGNYISDTKLKQIIADLKLSEEILLSNIKKYIYFDENHQIKTLTFEEMQKYFPKLK